MRTLAYALGFIAMAALPATAFDIRDPASVAAQMQQYGYRAKLDRTPDGDPLIRSSTQGLVFDVYFYFCENGRDCDALDFYAGFDLDFNGDPVMVNDWNREKIVGRATFGPQPQSVQINHVVVLGKGMPEDTFGETLATWDSVLAQFAEAIGYR